MVFPFPGELARASEMGLLGVFSLLLLLLSSCATATPDIPTTYHAAAKRLVEEEAHRILSVTEDAGQEDHYQFHLANFDAAGKKLQGSIGVSLGDGQIYIDEGVARSALNDEERLQFLRLVLAHEIAHDVADHQPNQKALVDTFNILNSIGYGMSYVPGPVGWAGAAISWATYLGGTVSVHLYARSQELEADKLGIEYWKSLGWDCQYWVKWFQTLSDSGHEGDFHHPTEGRLEQAEELCPLRYKPVEVQTAKVKLPEPEIKEITPPLDPSPWQQARAKFSEPALDDVTTSPSPAPGWEQAKIRAEPTYSTSLQWISLDKPLSVEAATAYLTYMNIIEKSIEGAWKYPEQATRINEEAKVEIDFTIRQDGWLENVRVTHSSGVRSLDNQAIKSVVTNEPYNPVPEAIGLEKLNLSFTFNYDLQ